ncbi:MAG: 23S rRNA (uracil(1939)-C(5))-methyltransferase RlmD [Lachnospiraceae bacterium]|nr:23S rRNA (uracil(1939)-C(5))-methyltransferase RlmD [Lachnospiraceae bacterium]
MKKDDIITVRIEDFSNEGLGVGYVQKDSCSSLTEADAEQSSAGNSVLQAESSSAKISVLQAESSSAGDSVLQVEQSSAGNSELQPEQGYAATPVISSKNISERQGPVLFVKDTIIGDVAEVKVMKMKKTYGYARLLRILTPSPDRVEAACPVARPCGGCQIQEMRYDAQLRFKEQKVRSNLQRIGGFAEPPMEPIIGMENPFRYRNKAQYPIGRDKNGKLIAGFYAGRTHTVIDCRDCLLGAKVNRTILDIVLNHMETYGIEPYDEETGTGLVRHVMIRVGKEALGVQKSQAPGQDNQGSGQIMVCIVINGNSLPKSNQLVQTLRVIPGMTSIMLNINRERTNVIMGRQLKLLWGKEYIEDTIGNVRFCISPLSFYQVNPRQTEKLYAKALEYAELTGQETVWDLYCGIGTISLFLAQKARAVYGVEIVPDAIRDARQNAKLNHITNAEFFVGKAEEVLPEKYEKEGIHADVIVVDPPRKGCDMSVLDTMLKIRPERIVYVSCDSATLARDLKYLCAGGYELKKVCPTDMFANSCHVETVVSMSRNDTQ